MFWYLIIPIGGDVEIAIQVQESVPPVEGACISQGGVKYVIDSISHVMHAWSLSNDECGYLGSVDMPVQNGGRITTIAHARRAP